MNVDNLQRELQFAFRDPRDIEQIVDQPRFELDVAANHFERFVQFRRAWRACFQFADHCDDRRKRIAQLVREQGEELILRGVRAD